MNVAALRADPQYGALKDYIVGHTGLWYYADKDEDFATRLSRRLQVREAATCGSYFRLLTDGRSGRDEMDRLVGELTIGETYFFRQKEHFELLRHQILPDLLERNRVSRMLRIWSAGCATGAEPYSISLLLQSEFRAQLAGWNVSILATDINVDFLARAREARFADWALRETPEEIKNRCFVRDGAMWLLRPEFRKGVTFQYQNLASETDLANAGRMFDLILCRNVLIYFSRAQTAAVVERFHECLTPGGWLLVGYAEPNMEMFKMFETVSSAEATAYRKSSGESAGGGLRQTYTWTELQPQPREIAGLPVETFARHTAVAEAPPQESRATVEDLRMLADSGHWDAAMALAQKLLETEGLNPGMHFTAALIHDHLGETQKAREALRRAIYLDRSFALAHYHLGTSFKSTNEQEPARRALQNALELLAHLPDEQPLPHGDSITVGELRALAIMHLNMDGKGSLANE
jgi:chemotaxis protein methyltransferase CheR